MTGPRNNYAFIDSQNVHLAVLGIGWEMDWKKFRIYLRDKFGVTKAFLFIGYVASHERLYLEMRESGYLIVFKPTLEYRRSGRKFIKGNVDAELVLHAMIEIENYEKAVIATGDGDFHCLIEHLIKKDKLERLLTPNRQRFSSLLRKFRPYFAFLDIQREKISKNKERE